MYDDEMEMYDDDFPDEAPITSNELSYKKFVDMKKISTLESDGHAKNLLKFLNECFKKGHYCDVIVKTSSRSFNTHRVVLAMFSDYFRAYLQLDGKKEEVITLAAIDGDIFNEILTFAYTGHFQKHDDTIEEVVICADYLGVTALKDICENNLIDLVSLNTCVHYWQFSDMYTMKSLFEVCREYFQRNFVAFISHKDFLKLPLTYLMIIFDDCQLRIYKSVDDKFPISSDKREKYLLKAALKYIAYNLINVKDNAITELLKLLELVKLPNIDWTYINNQLKKYERIRKYPDIKSLVDSSKLFKSTCNTAEQSFPKSWYTPRLPSFCNFLSGRKFASAGYVGKTEYSKCCPMNLTNIYRKLNYIKIFFRRWDGRLVMGGMELGFNDGCVVAGGENCSSTRFESSSCFFSQNIPSNIFFLLMINFFFFFFQ